MFDIQVSPAALGWTVVAIGVGSAIVYIGYRAAPKYKRAFMIRIGVMTSRIRRRYRSMLDYLGIAHSHWPPEIYEDSNGRQTTDLADEDVIFGEFAYEPLKWFIPSEGTDELLYRGPIIRKLIGGVWGAKEPTNARAAGELLWALYHLVMKFAPHLFDDSMRLSGQELFALAKGHGWIYFQNADEVDEALEEVSKKVGCVEKLST